MLAITSMPMLCQHGVKQHFTKFDIHILKFVKGPQEKKGI
jgi:hypothetical protein